MILSKKRNSIQQIQLSSRNESRLECPPDYDRLYNGACQKFGCKGLSLATSDWDHIKKAKCQSIIIDLRFLFFSDATLSWT